jgi:hypothetical protein
VFVVAVASLARPAEEEAPALARDVGVTVYEAGLALRAASPAIVLRTEDRARALAVLAALRDRGHEAVALDAAQIVPSDAMHAVRAFRFEREALVASGSEGGEDRAAYAELFAIVRATHASKSQIIEKSKERKLSLGRAAMSGGMLLTKSVEKVTTRTTEERELVAYLFRNDGAPWIVRASRTRYDGLGAELRHSAIENFQVFLKKLRDAAPAAAYDERLLTGARAGVDASSTAAVDLLAHLVAVAISRRARAYREREPSAG